MKKKNMIILIILIIILILLLIVNRAFYKKTEKDNIKENITSNEVYKINYKEANYNMMVANEIEEYIENEININEIKDNEKLEITTEEILTNITEEYETCSGNVEFEKINEHKYTYTIKSDCNDENSKKVVIKGYYNPFNKEEFYRVNSLNKTSYGYLALADKPEIEEYDDGYAMYLVSFDTVIKYDENMNEISHHSIKVENNNITEIEELEDGKYTVLSDDGNNNYYISILDENFNLMYTVSTHNENLNYIRMYNNEYYYSFLDKVYKIDKDTKELILIKDQTYDEIYRTLKYENNLLYSSFTLEENKTGISIYNDNYEIISESEYNGSNIFANEKMIVVSSGNTVDDKKIDFYSMENNELLLTITPNYLIEKLIEDELLNETYDNYSDISLDIQEDGLFIVLKVQKYDETLNYMTNENILIIIDNDLNIKLINIFKSNYLESAIKRYGYNFGVNYSSYNEFKDYNKYIEHITVKLEDKDLLLYAIYE